MDEEEEDESDRQLHIVDEEEKERELNSSLPATTDISTSMFLLLFFKASQYLYLVSTISHGEKRSSEENVDSPNKRKKNNQNMD
jgi:hypothetical protein